MVLLLDVDELELPLVGLEAAVEIVLVGGLAEDRMREKKDERERERLRTEERMREKKDKERERERLRTD